MVKYFSLIGVLCSMSFAMQDYRCSSVCLCDGTDFVSVDSFDDVFTQGEVSGHIRLAHVRQNNDATTTPDTYGTAIGGEIKYESAKYYNTSIGLSLFVSQNITPLSGDFNTGKLNLDFFDGDGSSLTYFGEAYIDYYYNNFDLRIGRQKLDTPFNDRDDIRMVPNTFEAVTLGYGGIKDFVFVSGYITAWAGYDSGQNISKFKDIPGTIGATGETGKYAVFFGVMNKSFENVELQAWYYGFDKQTDLEYIEATYEVSLNSDIGISLAGQYAHYHERSSSMIEGDVYGGVTGVTYKGIGISFAYNDVITPGNQTIIIGYGGGPYYTSMEEMTIDSIDDASAYVVGMEIDLSQTVLQNLGFSYAFGRFDGTNAAAPVEYEEHDIIFSYIASDKLDFEASYALVDDKKNSGSNDAGYKRTLLRLNYAF